MYIVSANVAAVGNIMVIMNRYYFIILYRGNVLISFLSLRSFGRSWNTGLVVVVILM